MSRDGWAALPRAATGLSAVCDCGISWSYSLTIFGVVVDSEGNATLPMNTVFWYLYSYSISSAFISWIHFVKKNFERVINIYIYVYWRIKLLNLPVRVIKPARVPLSSRFAALSLHLGFQSYVLGWCQGWVANHMLLVFSQYISLAPFCLHHKSHSHICNGLLSLSLCMYRTVLISMFDVNFCYHVVKIGIAWYQMIHYFVYFSLL